MRKSVSLFAVAVAFCSAAFSQEPVQHATLETGAAAPDFKLPGIDGKTYTLSSFATAKIIAVVFTCNHCPTAQAYEDRLIKMTADYAPKGVAVVAVMPNDPAVVSLDELGYTDLGDSFDEMKLRSKEKHFNFPYLYDGATEATSIAYGPVATPHIFIFDKARKLRYSGRIDDTEKPSKIPANTDARNAIDALLSEQPVAQPTTKVFGCSVKWTEKNPWVLRSNAEWAKEPVKLDTIGSAGVRKLLTNSGEKLRLITFWPASAQASDSRLSDFVTIHRMYRGREFETVTVSIGSTAGREQVLQTLRNAQAAFTNYIFTSDVRTLIPLTDGSWNGKIPLTLLVEPGGKVVYRHHGAINPAIVKRVIVENHLIGRYY